jgi:hypothetical protein
MYNLLKDINNNFSKLFTNCNDKLFYNPLLFNTSNDIEALIVLYQIIQVYYSDNIIYKQILDKIIMIKCNEFCINANTNESFVNSFVNYIEYFTQENGYMITF